MGIGPALELGEMFIEMCPSIARRGDHLGDPCRLRLEGLDLALDPQERRNVAGDATVPDAAAALTEMRGRLDAWMRRTNDPLVNGLKIPLPGPIKVNDAAGLSPGEPSKIQNPGDPLPF